MTSYLIQVCTGVAIWWLVYQAFLKGKAAAKTNRFFLLGGLVFPFLLPLIPLSVEIVSAAEPILLPAFTISTAEVLPVSVANSINWIQWFYMIGFAGMLLFQLSGIRKFFILKKHASKDAALNVFRLAEEAMPFSFFGSIFLPQHLPIEQETLILDHEKWHIKLGHSLDVAWAALVQSVLWFFPLIPVYVRDLRTEHEFEVDEKMLGSTSFSTYAETLLQVSLMPIQHVQFNAFSAPTLKKRIKMMTITQKRNTWKLILFLPLIASMLYLHACNNQAEETTSPVEETSEEEANLQITEVDAPPQFADCATDESAEAKTQCFNNGIMKQIMNNLKYPESAREAGIVGIMYIGFVVNADGNISTLDIKRSIPKTPENEVAVKEMEDAATAVFKTMPKLIPAQKDGKAVAVEFVVPINFALPPAEEPKK
jgi:TonB family protein